jgi:hypothetical protein
VSREEKTGDGQLRRIRGRLAEHDGALERVTGQVVDLSADVDALRAEQREAASAIQAGLVRVTRRIERVDREQRLRSGALGAAIRELRAELAFARVKGESGR